MNIAIISGWENSQKDLADITWPNKQQYCQKHGYQAIGKIATTDRHPIWLKIIAARESLSLYDWILLLDIDTLILNFNITLESFLDTSADLIATYDVNGINCGVMFLRNSPWTIYFLDKVWNIGKRYAAHPGQDQSTIAHLLYAEPKEKFEILPQRKFNSYLYSQYPDLIFPEGNYQPGDFILHLPSLPNQQRIKIFQSFLQQTPSQS